MRESGYIPTLQEAVVSKVLAANRAHIPDIPIPQRGVRVSTSFRYYNSNFSYRGVSRMQKVFLESFAVISRGNHLALNYLRFSAA